MTTAINEFTTERRRYREKVEAEVVQLALSIARKVLQREAQLDPLLLAGAVRVGLDRLPKEAVVLRVPPATANSWKAFFAKQHELACPPEIVLDPALNGESCVLESRLGSMELGVETQLTAIERGLSELLGPSEAVQP
jgi:flagellar assembly protein FliH